MTDNVGFEWERCRDRDTGTGRDCICTHGCMPAYLKLEAPLKTRKRLKVKISKACKSISKLTLNNSTIKWKR